MGRSSAAQPQPGEFSRNRGLNQPSLRQTDPEVVDLLFGVRQASQHQEGNTECPDKPGQAPVLGAGAPLVLRGGAWAAGQGARERVGMMCVQKWTKTIGRPDTCRGRHGAATASR